MKINYFICVLILICLCTYNYLYAEVVDRILVIVNGDIITRSELDKETEQYRKQFEFSGESEIKHHRNGQI